MTGERLQALLGDEPVQAADPTGEERIGTAELEDPSDRRGDARPDAPASEETAGGASATTRPAVDEPGDRHPRERPTATRVLAGLSAY